MNTPTTFFLLFLGIAILLTLMAFNFPTVSLRLKVTLRQTDKWTDRCLLLLFFIPQVVKVPGVKNTKAKIKMSDGQRSGRSTGSRAKARS